MTDRVETPKIPTERLDTGGWSLTETTTETLFERPGLRVVGETALYEDVDLRAALAAADDDLDIEGWVGVRVENGTFRLAGGAYPTKGFEEMLAATNNRTVTDPSTYRNELLDLIRG